MAWSSPEKHGARLQCLCPPNEDPLAMHLLRGHGLRFRQVGSGLRCICPNGWSLLWSLGAACDASAGLGRASSTDEFLADDEDCRTEMQTHGSVTAGRSQNSDAGLSPGFLRVALSCRVGRLRPLVSDGLLAFAWNSTHRLRVDASQSFDTWSRTPSS